MVGTPVLQVIPPLKLSPGAREIKAGDGTVLVVKQRELEGRTRLTSDAIVYDIMTRIELTSSEIAQYRAPSRIESDGFQPAVVLASSELDARDSNARDSIAQPPVGSEDSVLGPGGQEEGFRLDNTSTDGYERGASVDSADSHITVARPRSIQAAGDQKNPMELDQPQAPVQQPHNQQIVAALEALQPNGSFDRDYLTVDELRTLSNEDSEWSLQELQFRLASMAHRDHTSGFGRGRMNVFMDPVNLQQLLPMYDTMINTSNPNIKPSKGQNYIMGRIVGSAQGRVVHHGPGTCDQCQKVAGNGWGKKRYCQCVTAVDANRNAIFDGACANCAHNDHPERCSFYTGS